MSMSVSTRAVQIHPYHATHDEQIEEALVHSDEGEIRPSHGRQAEGIYLMHD